MSTDRCYRYLLDRPVKSSERARVAALMSAFTVTDRLTLDQAYAHWRDKRPDFFTAEAHQ